MLETLPDLITPHADGKLFFSGRRAWARLGHWRLTSHFQPIFSLSHRRVVGHEGLLRAFDDDNFPVPPGPIIAHAARDIEQLQLVDRLCRELHVCNFMQQDDEDGWLFLNIHPALFRQGPTSQPGDFLPELATMPLDPQRVVIEVMEDAVPDNSRFADTVAALRERGCRIALDDFGAGHSNFDRIWSLSPEIVKLDRTFALRSAREPAVRRMLPRMVALIHQAGSLVLLEGVESADQALIALDADIDFVQGYHFATPAAEPVDTTAVNPLIEALWERFHREQARSRAEEKELLGPYVNAIGFAASLLEAGQPLDKACRGFLELDRADTCYLLDEEGRQVGSNAYRRMPDAAAVRGTPLSATSGARWSRRPYFRRAVECFGRVQATRPYASITNGKSCVTVSIACRLNGQTHVLCGDMAL